eukprot:PhF_6_TR31113/c0_g1_i1/m.45525/K02183/CALM; calmodulin
MRSLGHYPSDIQLQQMCNESCEGSHLIDFPEFLMIMARRASEVDVEEEMMEAFRAFDYNGSGIVSLNVVSHVMMKLGTPVPEDLIMEIAHGCMDGMRSVNYEAFVKKFALT